MSAGRRRGYRAQEDWLPMDEQALSLESQGLWRRAAARWQRVLLRETDDRASEAILQRHDACLRQAIRHRVPAAGDTPPPAGRRRDSLSRQRRRYRYGLAAERPGPLAHGVSRQR